jgi:regulatory protein
MPDKKPFTTQKDLVLAKLQKYCAYQDRCHAEVRDKLIKLEIYGDDLEEIIAELITTGFLNEERYARSFVRGKFRMNHWGRNKIVQGLKAKRIPLGLIRVALEEIDDDEYQRVLQDLLNKKAGLLNEPNPAFKQKKLVTYALNKGFEYELIRDLVESMK